MKKFLFGNKPDIFKIFKQNIFLIIIFTFLIGCISKNIPQVKLFSSKKNINNKDIDFNNKEIDFAIGAIISPAATFKYYKDLIAFMEESTGEPVNLVQRETYGKIDNLLIQGKVDAAIICTGPYTKIKNFVHLIAIPQINKRTFYQSLIIVKKNTTYKTIFDLKNRSFAFTDTLSNTGKLYPTYLLAEKNIKPSEFFSKIVYTKSHDNSIRAVSLGLIDGAAVHSLVFDLFKSKYPEGAENIKVISKSPFFAVPPVVVSNKISKEKESLIKNFFLNLHKSKEGKKILKQIRVDKFVTANEKMYSNIEKMQKVVTKINGE